MSEYGESSTEGSLWGPASGLPPWSTERATKESPTLRNCGQEKGMRAHQSDKLAHPRLPAAGPLGGCSRPSAVGSKAHRLVSTSTYTRMGGAVCAGALTSVHTTTHTGHVYGGDHGHPGCDSHVLCGCALGDGCVRTRVWG